LLAKIKQFLLKDKLWSTNALSFQRELDHIHSWPFMQNRFTDLHRGQVA